MRLRKGCRSEKRTQKRKKIQIIFISRQFIFLTWSYSPKHFLLLCFSRPRTSICYPLPSPVGEDLYIFRVYHFITSPSLLLGENTNPLVLSRQFYSLPWLFPLWQTLIFYRVSLEGKKKSTKGSNNLIKAEPTLNFLKVSIRWSLFSYSLQSHFILFSKQKNHLSN